jgi:hypothetical protein
VIVASLTILVAVFARFSAPHKYIGYMIAVFATVIALVGYSLLHTFLVHTEFIFALSVIGVNSLGGMKPGVFAALLAILDYAVATTI